MSTLQAASNCEGEEQAAAEKNIQIYRQTLNNLYLALRGAKQLLNCLLGQGYYPIL